MDKRLSLLVLLTLLFAISVLVWYFFFVTPKSEPTLSSVSLPIASNVAPPRSGFIGKIVDSSKINVTRTTKITPAEEQPILEIWNKPTTGNIFVNRDIIKDVYSTTTIKKPKSTTTIEVVTKKSVHATSTHLMFVDRMSGYIYDYNIDTNYFHQISNTTIPGIYDAYIFNNGKKVLLRYLDADRKTIISVIAKIPDVEENTEPRPLQSVFYLPKGVSSVAMSASTNKISYLVPRDNSSSIYTITTKDQSLTAESPFSEWNISYGGEQLYATSKPSAYIEGETVTVPSFSRVIGDRTGLLSNPYSNNTSINSMLSNTGLVSFVISSKLGAYVLDIKTLASKCGWGSKGFLICGVPNEIPTLSEGLPDDWYQGRIQFVDNLYFVDINTGHAFNLFSFDSSLGDMDVTHLNVSTNNEDISFIRKQDSTLWLFRPKLIAY